MSAYSLHIPIFIVLTPLFAAGCIPLLCWRKPQSSYLFCLIALLVSTLSSLHGCVLVWSQGPITYAMGGWAVPLGIAWRLDALSAFMSSIVSGSLFVILFGVKHTLRAEARNHQTPYHMCLLLMTTGLLGMIMAEDLFNLFVFLEVASLSAYALLGLGPVRGSIAAYRYLLIGTVGASLYLLGVGFIYAMTGTLNMTDAAHRLSGVWQHRMVLSGLSLMVAGLALKAALVPLHGWLPNVYAYTSNSSTALIAPIMSKVSIYALIRILAWVAQAYWHADSLLLSSLRFLCVVAIIFGPLAARIQTDFRRLLAYSSIGQIGLIVLGVSFANTYGLTGALLHVLNDVCAKAVLFLTACVIARQTSLQKVSAVARLRNRMSVYWVLFIIAALSMVGIPPTLGFFSKWYLILGALKQNNLWMAGLIVVSGLLSAVYIFVLVEQLFGAPTKAMRAQALPSAAKRRLHSDRRLAIASGLFACGLIVFGLLNQWIVKDLLQDVVPPNSAYLRWTG